MVNCLSKINTMSQVAGVTTETNTKGEIVRVTFDVEKHRDMIMPVLVQMGVLEKTQFEKDFERGISVEEARKRTHEFIRSLWKK